MIRPNRVALSQHIVARREELNMRQIDLARAIGASQQGMENIEVGRKGVAIARLAKIAVALDMPLDELIEKK